MNIFTRGDDIFLFAEMKYFIRGDEMPIRGDEVHRLTIQRVLYIGPKAKRINYL